MLSSTKLNFHFRFHAKEKEPEPAPQSLYILFNYAPLIEATYAQVFPWKEIRN